jgi:hypothetical protein
MHARDAADAARRRLGGPGACSDHMVYANTYELWQGTRASGQERPWCDEHFVSFTTMNTIARTRDQLRDTLGRCGIYEGRAAPPTGPRRLVLLRAVVTAALWPSVALVAGSEPTRSKDGSKGSQLVLHARDNFGLHVHPASTVAAAAGGAVILMAPCSFYTATIIIEIHQGARENDPAGLG